MSVLDILLQKKLIAKEAVREVRRQTTAGTPIDQALIANGVKPSATISASLDAAASKLSFG